MLPAASTPRASHGHDKLAPPSRPRTTRPAADDPPFARRRSEMADNDHCRFAAPTTTRAASSSLSFSQGESRKTPSRRVAEMRVATSCRRAQDAGFAARRPRTLIRRRRGFLASRPRRENKRRRRPTLFRRAAPRCGSNEFGTTRRRRRGDAAGARRPLGLARRRRSPISSGQLPSTIDVRTPSIASGVDSDATRSGPSRLNKRAATSRTFSQLDQPDPRPQGANSAVRDELRVSS